MEPVIQQLSEKLGISPDQARQGLDIVLAFVKTRLPEPLANQLDGIVAGTSEFSLASLLKGEVSEAGESALGKLTDLKADASDMLKKMF